MPWVDGSPLMAPSGCSGWRSTGLTQLRGTSGAALEAADHVLRHSPAWRQFPTARDTAVNDTLLRIGHPVDPRARIRSSAANAAGPAFGDRRKSRPERGPVVTVGPGSGTRTGIGGPRPDESGSAGSSVSPNRGPLHPCMAATDRRLLGNGEMRAKGRWWGGPGRSLVRVCCPPSFGPLGGHRRRSDSDVPGGGADSRGHASRDDGDHDRGAAGGGVAVARSNGLEPCGLVLMGSPRQWRPS